jgi:hypothetical protein
MTPLMQSGSMQLAMSISYNLGPQRHEYTHWALKPLINAAK